METKGTNNRIQYKIFQNQNRDTRFLPLSILGGEDKVNPRDYLEVYSGETRDIYDSEEELLEYLFRVFNTTRPPDFKGHSMGVSDIIEVNNDWWYCDSIGFVKLGLF